MTLLKETRPIARKSHRCNFCHGTIAKGEKYIRQTSIFDGSLGDFICHEDCQEVASALHMYDDCDPDYGLTDDMFRETIDQYIYDNHYGDALDDTALDWQNLSLYEQVKKIARELGPNDARACFNEIYSNTSGAISKAGMDSESRTKNNE